MVDGEHYILLIKLIVLFYNISVLDAFGKLESAILQGNIRSLGSYDQCTQVTTSQEFTTKYCMASLSVSINYWVRLVINMFNG